jgi:predicted transcriptional regulator
MSRPTTHEAPPLTRRERQIMDVLFARGRASAAELLDAIAVPPTNSTMRTLLKVLEEKGHVRHEELGRVYYYIPTQPLATARRSALNHLIDTFFDGSVANLVSAIVKLPRKQLSQDEAERLAALIADSAVEGR